MLYNSKQQVVNLTNAEKHICNEGLAELAALTSKKRSLVNAIIRARQRILSPLRETKEQPDPNGRSCNGMFTIKTRLQYVFYSTPAYNGLKNSGRERHVLTN